MLAVLRAVVQRTLALWFGANVHYRPIHVHLGYMHFGVVPRHSDVGGNYVSCFWALKWKFEDVTQYGILK
jgi:hypothetical protein